MQKIAKIVSERHDAAALPKLNQFIYGRHIYRKKKLIAALGDIYHRYRVNRRL
jgi:hypothetical protein